MVALNIGSIRPRRRHAVPIFQFGAKGAVAGGKNGVAPGACHAGSFIGYENEALDLKIFLLGREDNLHEQ
jgi:hypothetical protein